MKTTLLALMALMLSSPLSSEALQFASTEVLKPFEPLMTRVLKSAGYEVSFSYMPQGRLISEEMGRTFDGVWFLTDLAIGAFEGMVKVPVPLYRNEVVAVTARPEVKIRKSADLSGYSVGVERYNRTHAEVAKDAGEIVEAVSNLAQFRMLAAGRFEVLVVARALVPGLAREAGLKTYFVQDPPLLAIPLYLGLTPKASSHVSKLTLAFQKVVDDGSWAKGIRAILTQMGD